VGAITSLLIGLASLGGMAYSVTSTAAEEKKEKKAAETATEEAKKTAEQKSLMETQEEQKTAASRKAILDLPTSGFGPNKNLARSFLTSL
jgi:Flp pilus assembly protein TadB